MPTEVAPLHSQSPLEGKAIEFGHRHTNKPLFRVLRQPLHDFIGTLKTRAVTHSRDLLQFIGQAAVSHALPVAKQSLVQLQFMKKLAVLGTRLRFRSVPSNCAPLFSVA